MPTPLPAALDRLVSRGVLTRSQADAVAEEVASGGSGGAPSRRVPPVAEVAAYLGGTLTVVAVGFLVAEPFASAPRGVRALLLALLTAVLVGAGYALRDPDGDDQVRVRLTSTLWVLAVMALGWAAFTGLEDGGTGDAVVPAAGAAALVLALPLYLAHRAPGQIVALVGALLVTLLGLGSLVDLDAAGTGLIVTVIGLVVLALGVAGTLEPERVSVPGGAALALVGLEIAGASDQWRGLMLLLGIVAAVALFALATRIGAALAGVATLGLTAALPQAISHFGGDGISMPAVLLVTGLALLGGAALTNRLRRED